MHYLIHLRATLELLLANKVNEEQTREADMLELFKRKVTLLCFFSKQSHLPLHSKNSTIKQQTSYRKIRTNSELVKLSQESCRKQRKSIQ